MIYSKLNRRAFLQGAGVTLAVPFMSSLVQENVLAAVAPQQRFVFMGTYFGRDIDHWYPKQAASMLSPEGVRHLPLSSIQGDISYILSPLNALRNKICVIRGLDLMQPDNGHSFSSPLTASGTLTGAPGFGYSIDAILEESAKFNRTITKIGALRTTAHNSQVHHGYSFSAKSGAISNLQTEWNPMTVYNSLFNPATLEQNRTANTRKLSITNRVMEDFRRIMGSRGVASDDKRKLDNYMTLLASVETRLGINTPACGVARAPGDVGTSSDSVQTAMIDLEVAALACGITNIVVHSIKQWRPLLDLGGNVEDHHAFAHGNGANPAKENSSVSQHAYYNRWVTTKVAEMLTKLNAIDDGGGKTLLDNTCFLYGNGESRGFHVHYDMPVIVAGGAGGAMRMGQYIDYRANPVKVVNEGMQLEAGRPYNNLLVTIFKALGLSEADYQKFNRPGFGSYDGIPGALRDYYDPFVRQPNAVLPFLS